MTATPRTITVAASNNLRRLASKPGYVTDLEREVAPKAGPFDAAGGAFPYDIPSQAFDHHLKQLDEVLAQAVIQLGQLRILAQSIRDVAEGRGEAVPPPPPSPTLITGSDHIDGGSVIARIVEDDRREAQTPIEIVATASRAELAKLKAESGPNMAAAITALTWTCPIHDQFAQAVSRKGRTYRYCPVPDCGRLDIMLEPKP